MESTPQKSFGKKEELANLSNEVKDFYKGDFKNMIGAFFKNPIDGLLNVFQNASEKSNRSSIILYVSVFLFYFLGSLLMSGGFRSGVTFGGLMESSLMPVFFMLIISVLAFGIKSVSGSPNIKNELLTGALCAIPLGIGMVFLLVDWLFGIDFLGRAILGLTFKSLIGITFFIYVLMMIINIFQQSLKAANTSNVMAWYLSPAAIMFAAYLTIKVTALIF